VALLGSNKYSITKYNPALKSARDHTCFRFYNFFCLHLITVSTVNNLIYLKIHKH